MHIYNILKNYYTNKSKPDIGAEQILEILSNTGAIHYTAIKLESFRLNTIDTLNRAEKLGIKIDSLREFLK